MSSNVDFSVLEQFCELLGEEGKSEAVSLVNLYLDDGPKQINTMKESLRQKDAETFRRAAHSFKSSSANVGAFELQSVCQLMESNAEKGLLDGMDLPLGELTEKFNQVNSELKKWASSTNN